MEFVGARLKPNTDDEGSKPSKVCSARSPTSMMQMLQKVHLTWAGFGSPPCCKVPLWAFKWRRGLTAYNNPSHTKGATGIDGASRMTGRSNLIWIARSAYLGATKPPARFPLFSPFLPCDARYTSNFVNRYASDKEQGIAIYVPINTLVDYGAGLAYNGVILCICKDGSRGVGARLLFPSLVDEFVYHTQEDEKSTQASYKFLGKTADNFGPDINIPFTYRNNVASVTLRVRSYTQHVSLEHCAVSARFMDQGCLGTPCALNSEITVDVERETADFDPVQQEIQEDEQVEDELTFVEELAADIDIKEIQDDSDQVDQCGEHEDYWNEYLAVSNSQATQSPALCSNAEELSKVLGEMLAYLIFQRKVLLDDFVAFSFKEVRGKLDDHRTPFASKQVFCPAFIDEKTN